MRAKFRPEFLNRLDEIVVFDALVKAQLDEILEGMLREVHDRATQEDLKLVLTQNLKDAVVEAGAADARYGARPLRRAVQRYVEDVVAECVLSGDADQTAVIEFDYDQATKNVLCKQQGTVVYQTLIDSANFGGIEAGADAQKALLEMAATLTQDDPRPELLDAAKTKGGKSRA